MADSRQVYGLTSLSG